MSVKPDPVSLLPALRVHDVQDLPTVGRTHHGLSCRYVALTGGPSTDVG